MIQTKALAPGLLRLRAAHSGSPPALKTMVKLKSRRPMALLARAVEVTHQLRSLAMPAAILRASSLLSSLAAERRPGISSNTRTAVQPGGCLSIALVPINFVVHPFGCRSGGEYDESKSIRDRQLLSIFPAVGLCTSSCAGGRQRRAEPSTITLSAIAHDVTTWLNHVAGNGARKHRAGRHSSPLPQPRPAAEAASARVASNKEWSEFVPSPGASNK